MGPPFRQGTGAGSAVSVSLRVSIAAPVDDTRGADGFPGGPHVNSMSLWTYFCVDTATMAMLMDVAADRGGYVPTRVAKGHGLVPARLVTLAHRGALERVGHGLYRIPGFPVDRQDDLLRAVLWTNERGAISHEDRPLLYELADVNPIAIDITVQIIDAIDRARRLGWITKAQAQGRGRTTGIRR